MYFKKNLWLSRPNKNSKVLMITNQIPEIGLITDGKEFIYSIEAFNSMKLLNVSCNLTNADSPVELKGVLQNKINNNNYKSFWLFKYGKFRLVYYNIFIRKLYSFSFYNQDFERLDSLHIANVDINPIKDISGIKINLYYITKTGKIDFLKI